MELSGYTFHQNMGVIRRLEYRSGRGTSNIPGLVSRWESNFWCDGPWISCYFAP